MMAIGDVLSIVVFCLWVMLPAYLPNNVAVVVGGGIPIDGGRTWGGNRVLGDGKTWRGTLVGTAVGILVAVLLNSVNQDISVILGVPFPVFSVLVIVSLPLGAMVGDIGASFIKRRTGRERGASFPVVDQLDFVFGALILTFLAAPSWFMSTFSLPVIVVIFIITPVLHRATNIIGYLLGFKQEPY